MVSIIPLPQDKTMVTRGGSRRALGDITRQQSNIVKVNCSDLLYS